jgi:hypothetical protein
MASDVQMILIEAIILVVLIVLSIVLRKRIFSLMEWLLRRSVFELDRLKASKNQHSPKTSRSSTLTTGAVFISYRREDSADITGRIYDRLLQRLPKEAVFKDVDSIPLGIDFRQHLEKVLGQCDVVIAVIGDYWIQNKTLNARRRIDDPRDHLRMEIEMALNRDIPVIPVLVRNASMPSEEELPPSLRALAYRNGIPIRPDPDFHTDMDRLIKGIEVHLNRVRSVSRN